MDKNFDKNSRNPLIIGKCLRLVKQYSHIRNNSDLICPVSDFSGDDTDQITQHSDFFTDDSDQIAQHSDFFTDDSDQIAQHSDFFTDDSDQIAQHSDFFTFPSHSTSKINEKVPLHKRAVPPGF
jgi:hypothetical protein